MKTNIEMESGLLREFKNFAQRQKTTSKVFPKHFIEIMKTNRGICGSLCREGTDENGLERRNPLVVILGDSVTAGHFEQSEAARKAYEENPRFDIKELDVSADIIDIYEAYPEIFKRKLVEKFEETSVNVVNAGIAGDTLVGMSKRLKRDVISFQPDLVIINGSLNWSAENGTAEEYYQILKEMVKEIQINTQADIVLMTPNMMNSVLYKEFQGTEDTLEERVDAIRKIADQEKVCLADTYSIWKQFASQGHQVGEMLANMLNHPTKGGHEIFADELMKLF
ncbi:GDSL-type esterase/lipase family protein [Lachnospiraceae bacterium 29-91]